MPRVAVVGAGTSRLTAAYRLQQAGWDCEVLVDRTLRTVFEVFPELRGTVDYTHVTRWRRALPFTRIGSYKEIGRLNATIDPRSPIQYAADFMSAVGQNTAAEYGNRAARNIIGRQTSASAT
jgi:oxygen-dependent protoporphyrinogen oxidase